MNNEHKPLYYMPLCKKKDCGDRNCFECPIGDKIQDWERDGRDAKKESEEDTTDGS